MLNSEDWRSEVLKEGVVMCPSCGLPHPTLGACAIGAMTIHQEYVCENCGHEFAAVYSILGRYDGIGDT
jgi:transposase-like protein